MSLPLAPEADSDPRLQSCSGKNALAERFAAGLQHISESLMRQHGIRKAHGQHGIFDVSQLLEGAADDADERSGRRGVRRMRRAARAEGETEADDLSQEELSALLLAGDGAADAEYLLLEEVDRPLARAEELVTDKLRGRPVASKEASVGAYVLGARDYRLRWKNLNATMEDSTHKVAFNTYVPEDNDYSNMDSV